MTHAWEAPCLHACIHAACCETRIHVVLACACMRAWAYAQANITCLFSKSKECVLTHVWHVARAQVITRKHDRTEKANVFQKRLVWDCMYKVRVHVGSSPRMTILALTQTWAISPHPNMGHQPSALGLQLASRDVVWCVALHNLAMA